MLRRYLTGMLLVRVAGSLLGLVAILQLLDLLDKAGSILSRGGVADIGRFIALRTPSLFAEALPLATLLGAVLTFLRLSGALEMTAMRAAGISLRQILRALLPACLLVSAAQFVLQTEVAPRAERRFADWWAATDPVAADPAAPRLWLRAHGDIAAVDRVSLDGGELGGLSVAQRSSTGDLTAWLEAGEAVRREGRWTLHDVRIARPGVAELEYRDTMEWANGPSPANMVELARPIDLMTLGRLIETLRGRWVGGRAPAFYWTELDRVLSALLDPFVMVLLAEPVLLAPPRTAGGAPAATSLALGLGYLVCAGLLTALGNAGTLPPLLAGWSATLLFAVMGLVRLLQAEA